MARAKSGTLTANTAAGETITDAYPGGISISKLPDPDGTYPAAVIWYRLDGVDPTVGGDDCFPCVDTVHINHPADAEQGARRDEAVEVRMIADAAVRYAVEGNPVWKKVTA